MTGDVELFAREALLSGICEIRGLPRASTRHERAAFSVVRRWLRDGRADLPGYARAIAREAQLDRIESLRAKAWFWSAVTLALTPAPEGAAERGGVCKALGRCRDIALEQRRWDHAWSAGLLVLQLDPRPRLADMQSTILAAEGAADTMMLLQALRRGEHTAVGR